MKFLVCFSSLLGVESPSFLSDKEYQTSFAILTKAAHHQRLISDEIAQRIKKGEIQRGNFLDIGCGPGTITRELMPYFASTTVVEPNREFASLFSEETVSVHPISLKDFHTDARFDLILCSHVLYHIPQEEWRQTIDKMMQLLSADGVLVIAMESPGSKTDLFRRQFNENYLGSVLKEANAQCFDVEAVYSKYFYEIDNSDDLFSLCRFLVLGNCFTPESYSALPTEKRVAIDEEIRAFVKTQSNEFLDWNQELLFFRHPTGQ